MATKKSTRKTLDRMGEQLDRIYTDDGNRLAAIVGQIELVAKSLGVAGQHSVMVSALNHAATEMCRIGNHIDDATEVLGEFQLGI